MTAIHDPAVASRRQLFGKLAHAGAPAMHRPGKAALLDLQAPATEPLAASPAPLVRWLHKASFGFCRDAHEALLALGSSDDARWSAWVEQQLNPQSLADDACQARIDDGAFSTLAKSLPQLWTQHARGEPNYFTRRLPVHEVECATVIRAVYSERQLYERTVNFWHDHFSVYGHEHGIAPVFVHYDRDVIRPNAFGNFRQMLENVAQSTAMQLYLDNYASRGADFNENYARELIELHTLGAANYFGPTDPFGVPCLQTDIHCPGGLPAGYVDNDVYEAAAAMTGWTIRNGYWQYPADDDGSFIYRANWHDRRNKIFLGRYIPPNHQPAMEDGHIVFDRLVAHPGTARHIATKLCRRFIGDAPSAALIEAVADAFHEHIDAPDQIARMLRIILLSSEYKQAWGGGMRRPFEVVMGSLRALESDVRPEPDTSDTWTAWDDFTARMAATGHRLFAWTPPDGYPDSLRAWASTGSLAMTMRLLARIPEMPVVRDGSPMADIVGQTMQELAPAQRSATTMVDYWCDRLLGWRPQPAHAVVTDFLRQNAAADDVLELDERWSAGDLKHHYTQQRLRTAVGMLLTAPENFRR